MKKGLILAALLAVSGSVFASDLSSVGTVGLEATTDYSYARSINTPYWDSTHVALAGAQLNLGGLGSVAVEAGDTQRVTDFRLNYTTFAVGYANGIKVGSLGVVGSLNFSELTGDKWFLDNGNNSSLPISIGSGMVEVNAPVAKTLKLFADLGRSYAWSGNINSFYKNGVVVKTSNSNAASVGTYVNFSKSLVAKVGYSRGFDSVNTQGMVASLSYKF